MPKFKYDPIQFLRALSSEKKDKADAKDQEANQASSTADDVEQLLGKFMNNVKVKNNRKGLFTYDNTFVGSDAVAALIKAKVAKDVAEAEKMGELLDELGGFDNVTGGGPFRNDSNLYRFAKHDEKLKHYNLFHMFNGFYHVQAVWKFMGMDLGTQMSLIQLKSGRFLVIDCVDMTPNLKLQIDVLTNKGSLIDAVLNTHPFHTIHIPAFRELYPDVPFYGCPRHLTRFPEITWAGCLCDQKVLEKWEPEVSLRVPDGLEMLQPEEDDHASSVFVYHHASRTLHTDDTLMYGGDDPSFVLNILLYKNQSLALHPAVRDSAGSTTRLDAFRQWLSQIVTDWPIDNIVAAHQHPMVGGARKGLKVIVDNEKLWSKLKAGKPIKNESKLTKAIKADLATNKGKKQLKGGKLDNSCECG